MIIQIGVYRDGVRCADSPPLHELQVILSTMEGPGDFIWVGMHDPEPGELDEIAKAFSLHPLAVEDALKAHQRPKLDRYDESLFLALKTLRYVDEEDAVETGEINVFSGANFVITVRHGEAAALAATRHRLESTVGVLKHGPSAVIYGVCDLVVDGYEDIASALELDVDEVEESVFSERRTRDSARIYRLKREIAEVRRAVVPLRDPLRRFSHGLVEGMDPEADQFFRDVYDHLMRVSESVDSLDILLSTAFDAHLAAISLQQNEDMRTISAAIGLVAVPTLIAGVYGMNFVHMPELQWFWGYPFALLLMAGSSLALWVFFKRSGWL
ncbi:MAG: magnesium/cobalt transporter CorA [Nocardioides sp.]